MRWSPRTSKILSPFCDSVINFPPELLGTIGSLELKILRLPKVNSFGIFPAGANGGLVGGLKMSSKLLTAFLTLFGAFKASFTKARPPGENGAVTKLRS